MRIAFMGTPDFSVPILNALIANSQLVDVGGHEIVAVYTQPPRPAGRGRKLRASPVQQAAEAVGLDVRAPLNFKSDEDRDAFAALNLDLAIVVAYGLILPKAILDAPRLGCVNLHASLLPRWRGAAPIHRAIMAGDQQTGIQLMQMEAGLDTGPILLSEATPIFAEDTTGVLHDRLAKIGADMIPRALAALERGSMVATTQAKEGMTYAEKVSPQEAKINWTKSAAEIDYHIRGLSPFPGAWFMADPPASSGLEGPVRIKALFSGMTNHTSAAPPGTVINADGILGISCGQHSPFIAPPSSDRTGNVVAITRLQRPGKSPQSADEFLRGFCFEPGMTLF